MDQFMTKSYIDRFSFNLKPILVKLKANLTLLSFEAEKIIV